MLKFIDISQKKNITNLHLRANLSLLTFVSSTVYVRLTYHPKIGTEASMGEFDLTLTGFYLYVYIDKDYNATKQDSVYYFLIRRGFNFFCDLKNAK